MARDPDPKIERRPDVGTVFNVTRFARPSAEGVAAGFQLTGYWDLPDGGFSLWTEGGVQKVKVAASATQNGDVGIERHFAAAPGDVFRLTSWVRVANKTGKFKARVNISARRRRDGKQVAEFNDSQQDVTNAMVERCALAIVPQGTDFLSVRVKFHTSAPGESGEGEIHSMRLERLPAPPVGATGTPLSLYNFNIHKMEDDWPGWIQFVADQRLRPPDIVLLQDIESDADRIELQQALGAAFGGTWTGRGTDRLWQTSIVWRNRRFSQASSRTWRGFGGETCVDNSQDAPALQVKLYDNTAKRWISLVSLKTPPKVDDNCVWSNVQKVQRSFQAPWAGDLCVVGTDANSPPRDPTGAWLSWYQRTVRSEPAQLASATTLGFRDPVADVCGLDPSRMEEHVTLPGKGRVDFLLLKTASNTPPAVVRQMTLPRGGVAGVKWSDHRCVHCEIAY